MRKQADNHTSMEMEVMKKTKKNMGKSFPVCREYDRYGRTFGLAGI